MERVIKCARHFFLLHLVSLKEPCWLNEDTIDHDKQAAAPPTGPKSGKHEKLDTATTDFLKERLKDLPTVYSHYCRSTATYKDKKFLHPGTTISQLLRKYQQAAATAGVRAVGIKRFTDVFHEGKYSVFIPRKDQCDVCVSFKHGNITKAEYDEHVNKKDEARQEKSRDKDSANNHKSITSPSSTWNQRKGTAIFGTSRRATSVAKYSHTFNIAILKV